MDGEVDGETRALLSFNELCPVETDMTDTNRFKCLWKIYEAAVLRKTHTISPTSCVTLQIPAAACRHNEASLLITRNGLVNTRWRTAV